MNRAAVEAQLAELPLAEYVWFETAELEFSERIRTVCRENCAGRAACPIRRACSSHR